MEKRDIDVVLAANTWGSADCTRTTKDFSTHGLDIILRRDGRHMVAMTNHLPRETVELFELVPVNSHWQLVWRGCVDAPSLAEGSHQPLFNDVALTAEGSFYVTEMYNGKMPFEALIEAGLTGANTGKVWRWCGRKVFVGLPAPKRFSKWHSSQCRRICAYVNYWFSGLTSKIDLETGTVVAYPEGASRQSNPCQRVCMGGSTICQ